MAMSGWESSTITYKNSTHNSSNLQTENSIQPRDSEKPFNWPTHKKWRICLVACYITFIVGLNATALTAAVDETDSNFGISDRTFQNSFWLVTAWNTGASLAPMIVLPIMEDYGVRPGYIIVYSIFFMFVIPQAVAQNFETLVVTRFFAGCCGGVLQDAMDGIIFDMWSKPAQRSRPVSCYVFALLSGLSSGPAIGGALVELGWRWIFYVQLIIYGASFPLLLLTFHETRYSVILSTRDKVFDQETTAQNGLKQSSGISDETINPQNLRTFLRSSIFRPFIFLTTEPVVFFFTLLSAFSFGLLFLATQSVPQVYESLYDFTEPQTGFIQAAIVLGEILGFLTCFLIGDPYFAKACERSARLGQPEPSQLPEFRLHFAIPACFAGLAGGLFVYGWTSYADLTFWGPAVGLILIGLGSVVVMQAIMMYITDAYANYAASASAAVCFGENMFAAFLPLGSKSLYNRLGFQWASSLLGFLAIALSFAPIMLVWKGRVIRERSRFMTAAT